MYDAAVSLTNESQRGMHFQVSKGKEEDQFGGVCWSDGGPPVPDPVPPAAARAQLSSLLCTRKHGKGQTAV